MPGNRSVASSALLALLLLAAPAHAYNGDSGDDSEEDPAGEFLFGDPRTAIGYGAHRGSFFELGYTFGFMPWLSADGRDRVMVSGLVYDENKGPLINLVTLLLALAGVSDTTYAGTDGYYDYYIYDPAGAARQRASLVDAFSHLPMSMGVRAYHSSLGSEADGFTLEASFRDPIGDDLVPVVVWGIGAHVGYFAASSQWGGAYFESLWGGVNADLRVSIFEYLGLWLRVGAWWGGPTDFALPIELGPEILIGNRFVLRGLASVDPMRPEALPDGIGMRLELSVRL